MFVDNDFDKLGNNVCQLVVTSLFGSVLRGLSPRLLVSWLILLFMTTHSIIAQDWYLRDHGIIITGQGPIHLGPIEVINRSMKTWQPGSEIKIAFSEDSKIDWDVSDLKVTRRGITLESTVEVVDHMLTINLHKSVMPSGTFRINGIVLSDVQGSTPYKSITVEVNGKRGNLMDIEIIRNWGNVVEENLFSKLFFILATDFKQDLNEDLHPIRYNLPSRTSGVFRFAEISIDIDEDVCFITNTKEYHLPRLIITNDPVKSILTKRTELEIKFPEQFKVDFDEVRLLPSGKVIGFKSNTLNVYKIKIKKKLKPDEMIIIEGIKLTSDRLSVSPKHISLEWKNPFQVGSVKLVSYNTMRVGNPKITMTGDIELVANAPVTEVPTLQIVEDKSLSTITKERNLFIEIPSNTEAYWSTDFRDISLTGTAASKVRYPPRVDNRKILEFDIVEDFQGGENLEISHLKMFAKRRSEEDVQSKRMKLRVPLKVHFNRLGSGESRYTRNQIKIVEVDLSSHEHQVMLSYDERKETKPILVSLKSDFVVLKKGDRLRFKLSDEFKAFWDPTMRKVNLTGPSSHKVSPIVRLDRRYPRSFILHVTEAFEGDEQFQIENLFLVSSGEPCRGELEMYLNNEKMPLAKDDKNWIIQSAVFSAKEDQIIFETDSITKSFSLTLDTKELSDYFETGDHILIEIPSKIPVTFNTRLTQLSLYGKSAYYLSGDIDFIDDRKVRITVANPVPRSSNLIISGLEYTKPVGSLAHPDTISCSLNNGFSYIRCKKSISIMTRESEYGSALYYNMLTESNFQTGDTIFFDLDQHRTLIWDEKYIRRNVKLVVPPATGEIDISSPLFFNEMKSLGFVIHKAVKADDFFRIHGLAVSKEYANDYSHLTLRYVNLYGPQASILKYPVNIMREGPEIQDGLSPSLNESYVFPIFKLFREEDKLLLTSNTERVILPEFEIQNGQLTPEDGQTYRQYSSTLSDLKGALNHEDFQRAENRGQELIRISPNTWVGYYYHARALKELENLSESQMSYTQAKQYGYIPNPRFPPLFEATVDDRALANVQRAEERISKEEYIQAEKRLKLVIKEHPDSLRNEIRGTAYYLRGEIALRLSDCAYAEDQFYYASDYGVIDEERYDLDRTELWLDKCFTSTDSSKDLLVIQPPIPEDDEFTEEITLTISSSLGYPYRLDIENKNNSETFTTRTENQIDIKSQNIYRLSYHPVQKQVGGFLLSFIVIAIFTGLIRF